MVNDSKSHRQRHQTQKFGIGWRLVFYTLELGAFKCPESALHVQKKATVCDRLFLFGHFGPGVRLG